MTIKMISNLLILQKKKKKNFKDNLVSMTFSKAGISIPVIYCHVEYRERSQPFVQIPGVGPKKSQQPNSSKNIV